LQKLNAVCLKSTELDFAQRFIEIELQTIYIRAYTISRIFIGSMSPSFSSPEPKARPSSVVRR